MTKNRTAVAVACTVKMVLPAPETETRFLKGCFYASFPKEVYIRI